MFYTAVFQPKARLYLKPYILRSGLLAGPCAPPASYNSYGRVHGRALRIVGILPSSRAAAEVLSERGSCTFQPLRLSVEEVRYRRHPYGTSPKITQLWRAG